MLRLAKRSEFIGVACCVILGAFHCAIKSARFMTTTHIHNIFINSDVEEIGRGQAREDQMT